MTDFRSEAEKFVTEFLNYIEKYDIKDSLNKQTQRMERSPGVAKLVKQAQSIFPPRVDVGKKETDKLTPKQVDEAVKAPNVIDTREMFARRIQSNGGLRALLRSLYKKEPGALERVREFLEAEDGEKEFASKPLSE